jgi:DNA-directed RNA polymerase I, II, and III subunit RPABC2
MDENEDFSEPEDLDSDTENEPIATKINPAKIKPVESDNESDTDEDLDNEDDDAENDEEDEDDVENEDNGAPEVENQIFPHFDEIEDDDSEDEDENYLQKFDEGIQKNIISDYHPEMISHNYSEIEALTRVVRDENGIIVDPLHRTLPFITRYEKARILGERAKQINSGAKPFVDVDINMIDGYVIALKEFEEKKIPFIVKRPLPSGGIEYWKFKDLEVLI